MWHTKIAVERRIISSCCLGSLLFLTPQAIFRFPRFYFGTPICMYMCSVHICTGMNENTYAGWKNTFLNLKISWKKNTKYRTCRALCGRRRGCKGAGHTHTCTHLLSGEFSWISNVCERNPPLGKEKKSKNCIIYRKFILHCLLFLIQHFCFRASSIWWIRTPDSVFPSEVNNEMRNSWKNRQNSNFYPFYTSSDLSSNFILETLMYIGTLCNTILHKAPDT